MAEHDQLFKRAFRVPEHAAGELEAMLPKSLFEAIDPGSLRLVQSDVVDHRLGERFADALFSASFRGVPAYVWLLLEHQSEPDRWMTLRVLDYMVRSWTELLRREPERQTLPPIVCVVVHHGERGWTAPVGLHELVDGVRDVPALASLVPSFEIIVDDLVAHSDEALQSRPLATFPKVVLWALRDARAIRRFYEHLVAWADELRRLTRESAEDAATVMRYVWTVVGDESFANIHQRIIEVAPATEDVMATVAEQLIQRGKAQGKAEGLAEGLAKGKAEGKAEGVLAVLEARGLTVNTEQRAQIAGCQDIGQLDRWLRLAATASRAADLFSH